MLAKGWIKPSAYLYSSPVLFFWKKISKLEICLDFYALNANVIKLAVFPLPHIVDFLNKLDKAKYSSSIDLAKAYH